MHYIDLQHSREQRTSIYNSDSAVNSGWKASFHKQTLWPTPGPPKREGSWDGRMSAKGGPQHGNLALPFDLGVCPSPSTPASGGYL